MEQQFLLGESALKELREHLSEASRRLALVGDHFEGYARVAQHIEAARGIVALVVVDTVPLQRARRPTEPLRMRPYVDPEATIMEAFSGEGLGEP